MIEKGWYDIYMPNMSEMSGSQGISDFGLRHTEKQKTAEEMIKSIRSKEELDKLTPTILEEIDRLEQAVKTRQIAGGAEHISDLRRLLNTRMNQFNGMINKKAA